MEGLFMSAIGTKRTNRQLGLMSATDPKADISRHRRLGVSALSRLGECPVNCAIQRGPARFLSFFGVPMD